MKLQHLYIHSYCIQSSERVSGRGPKWLKGWNTLGNNLQQHVVTISCMTNCLMYRRIFVQICLCNRILSLQQVTQNQIRLTEFVWLAVLKIVFWRQDFNKNSPVHTKRFVTARYHPTCCLTCTQDWYVAMMNCSDISPSVFPPLQFTVDYYRPPLWIPS